MKKLLQISLILFLLPAMVMATGEPQKAKYEKTKTIKKEYKVSANALVHLDNKYGNMDVVTWNENRVVIEVTITTKGNNESKVEAKLKQINVDFEANNSKVYAKTKFGSTSSWGKNNVQFQVDYKVKMPVTNHANLDNDYGAISLNELKGKAEINCDYGKINIGKLLHNSNDIDIDYTNSSTIELINGGEINADYSKFVVEKAKNVSLNADYTDSVFEHVEDLDFSCDYGKLEVKNANSINGNGDYLTMKLGTIFKVLDINADYGSIKIAELKSGFERVDLNTGYSAVKMGVESGSAFTFEINSGYGGVDLDMSDVNYNKKSVKSSSKYYQGYVKNNDNSSNISISSSYGGIKIFNN